MKSAPQPVRRNLRAKPAPPNLSICAQCASGDSARTLANSFASYHILASPAVSYNYALFCATARRYLSYSQWLPHSFYRHGGGTPRPLRWVPARFRSGWFRGNQIWPPFVFILLQIPFPATPFFSHPCKSPGGVGCNGFKTVSQQRHSERRCRPEFCIPYFEIFAMKTE